MRSWLCNHWKKILMGILLFISIGSILVLEVFSRGAAAIFNQSMMEQDMLKGDITAEKISANINGHVEFSQLQWHDPNGRLILYVPEGSFNVRLWDVVTGHIKSTTIQELTIRNATVAVRLAEDMSVDFVRSSPDMIKVKAKERLGRKKSVWWENRRKNEKKLVRYAGK